MFTNTINRKNILIIALTACVLELAGAIVQVNEMLRSVGVASVFSPLSLAGAD